MSSTLRESGGALAGVVPDRRLCHIGEHFVRSADRRIVQRSIASTVVAADGAAGGGAGGVLSGITVVEMSMVLAAPMCCALMADMGATVFKVEPPGGEIWRKDGPPAQFQQLNRGKRSIVLDTRKQPEALKALKQLIAKADVFVTNLREPALKAQGLDYDTLRHEFPRLVYAHMTAWGRDGPKKDDPGCALTTASPYVLTTCSSMWWRVDYAQMT